MKEVWKPVKGYEGLYEVSNLGRIKSLISSGRILKNNNAGKYQMIELFKDGKGKTKLVHRIVAEAFVPNPNGFEQVNHKDENKKNNCVDNLEWCTAKYNNNYGTRISRIAEKRGTRVRCVETGETYSSICSAAKSVGGAPINLLRALNGEYKTSKGYHWEYERGQNSSV